MREQGQLYKQTIQTKQSVKIDESFQPQEKAKLLAEKRVLSSGSHEEWMKAAGIPESDWNAVDYILSHESNWRVSAVNSSSGATGICQALPAQKMQSAGLDYMTNPITQLKWCNYYANSRYGGWQQAYQFWSKHLWW